MKAIYRHLLVPATSLTTLVLTVGFLARVAGAFFSQHLVRSVLSTRIALPAPESVSNRVLRAVLRGDMEGLTEAIKRKRLKGVAVALTKDDR